MKNGPISRTFWSGDVNWGPPISGNHLLLSIVPSLPAQLNEARVPVPHTPMIIWVAVKELKFSCYHKETLFAISVISGIVVTRF